MKVVIAGGGIAGNAMLRHLRKRNDVEVKAYEQRSYEDASPPGLNVLLNHNGLAATKQVDPELYAEFQKNGSIMVNWSARTVTGEILYHLENVVESGDANTAALVSRWDNIHKATRCDELTEYSVAVVDVVVQEESTSSDQLSVKLLRHASSAQQQGGEEKEEWIRNVDLLIAADGRYSAIRKILAPTTSYFGPPHVADFRIMVPDFADIDTYLNEEAPMWRVYNKPCKEQILAEFGNHPGIVAAASGIVRVGMMKLTEGCLGLFGNIAIPNDGTLHEEIKNPELLAQLFRPPEGEEPDSMGQLAIDVLKNHGHEAHWTRKQQTETCYEALDGKVLFIGDAAGAIYPSLGQGANLSLEDAAVAAAAFPDVSLIAKLRFPRREFIKDMSRQHAMHVAFPETYDIEMNNWSDPSSTWRADLKRLWCCGQQLALRAIVATKENFQPYGQLIAESLDGDLFDTATNDADLDLSKGTPRFYLMKLTGGRPLQVDRITRHQQVTQCLGSIGLMESFYMVVHAPDDAPTLMGLQAFLIPPRHFIKLHVATWHAGPMWDGDDDARTFMNLELADTNVVDHDTVFFDSLPPYASTQEKSSSGEGTKDTDASELVVPVMAVQ